MSDLDIPQLPPEARELLHDSRLAELRYRGPGRSKAGVMLAPIDPPAVGESPFLKFEPDYGDLSTAKVTWVNEPAGAMSVLYIGKGKGFAKLAEQPRFFEERVRPRNVKAAWVYGGWLIASPKFAGLVKKFDAAAVETLSIDWTFRDENKLEGYVFLDVMRRIHAYDYRRSEVRVRAGAQGNYIAGLGTPRALKHDLPSDIHIFRDAYFRHDVFVSRDLAKALAHSGFEGFHFEDPARRAPVVFA